MLRTFSTLLAIRTSSTANRLIFYAQKLPLIGGRIPGTLYSNLAGKKVISILATILTLLWGLLSKLAYTGLLVYLPAVGLSGLLSQEDQLQLFLHIFLLLSFGVAGITTATMLEPKREKFIAVKLMRMLPAVYMRTTLGYRYTTYLIFYIPALMIFLPLLGASFLQALTLAVSVTLWRVWCEYLHLKLFEKTGMVLIKNNLLVWLAIGLGYAAAYAPLVLDWTPNTGAVLFGLPTFLVISALGLVAAVLLNNYSNYRTVVEAATKRDDPLLDIGRMMTEAQKTAVRPKEMDDMQVAPQANMSQSREGYAYLNALFFSRHRSLITQPVYKRLAIIGGLGAVGAALAAMDSPYVAFLTSSLDKVLLYLAMVVNVLSVGERACRALFYNCDLSLMRYSFYRGAAHRHFRIRLFRIAGLNLAIAAAMGAALSLIAWAAGGVVVQELLLIWVSLAALSFFFSVHHLLMYYLLQPYSTELNMKNPFFFVVSMGVMLVCWVGVVVQPSSLSYAIAVLAVTAIYFVAALALVRRFGPRTFRVK
ncbi:hypothetical protein [Paenibacillus koleovorans]|uniref:hypothetical protein n=1 Tax=Paenibacillus koleovorans TaxID=121608 RepID=UPI000FDBDEEE|nr:hypothetical protein [Paenibacillus koleovorans]